MFCPECGTKNDDDALFCSECGTSLREYREDVLPEASEVIDFGQMYHQSEQPPYDQQTAGEVSGGQPPYGQQTAGEVPEGQQLYGQQTAGEVPEGQPPYGQQTAGEVPGGQPPYGQQAAGEVPGGQPPYGQRPAGETLRGQYSYGSEMGNRPEPIPKKKMSKAAIAAIIEGVLAVALLAGTYMVLDKKFSPETVGMEYWEATMAQEWSKAYDYCDFPENDFLNKQMYVNANSGMRERVDYNSARIEPEGQNGDNTTDTRSFMVEYLKKGSSQTEYSYLTLARTGEKKFLFWNEWKVVSSDSWCRDVEFTVPENSTLYLNGVEVTENRVRSDVDAGMSDLTIPYLFLGTYQMEVEAEGMEPYNKVIEIDTYGYDDSYIELTPSEETIADLVEQMGNDVKKILDSALAGKDFSEVEGLFTESAVKDGYVKDSYESMKELTGNGVDSGIVSLQVKNIQASVESVHGGRYVQLTASMDIDEKYHDYWGDGFDTNTDKIKFYPYYQKEGDTWKLTEIPFSYYQFSGY